MKVSDLVQVLDESRTVWVEDDSEESIECCPPHLLSERVLDLEVDFIYPDVIKSLGGSNVICVRVKENCEDEE